MKNRINIMHLMLSLQVGGMENGVVNILNSIRRDIFVPSVCCLEQIGSMANRIHHNDILILDLSKKPGFSPLLFLKLANVFKHNKIDIIHTHCWATLLYGFFASYIAKTPVIVHGEHGIFNLEKRRRSTAYNFMLKRVDKIFTVSNMLRKDLMNKANMSGKKIYTIINGVDTKQFRPRNSVSIKTDLGFNPTDIVIGSVGRLDKIKNYEVFIRCIALFFEPSIKGLLIGDGPLRQELEALTRELMIEDRFVFLGERSDVYKLLGAMDIFVCSSLSEGLSNTILETMSSGVPVVATNVGGNPEIVYHGQTGYLVEPNDIQATKSHLDRLVENEVLRQTMGRKARRTALSSHSLERMIKEYEEAYASFFPL
jgi:sugar transferase (PEP-CTERM/EpsH1 system associated)